MEGLGSQADNAKIRNAASVEKSGPSLVYFGALLALGTSWGLEAALSKASVEAGIDEFAALWLTLVGVTIGCVILMLATRRAFTLSAARIRFFVISGALGYLGPLSIIFYVADHVDAGLMTLIASLTPLFTVAGAIAFGLERVRLRTVFAVLLGAAGTLLILLPAAALPSQEMAGWALVALAIPVIYGVDNLYVAAALPRSLSSLQAATGEVICAMLLMSPIALIFSDFSTLQSAEPRGRWALIGLVITMIAEVYLFFFIIRRQGGVFTSFASFVTILAGFMWGFIFFGERPSAWVWGAVAVVFCALILLITKGRGAARSAEKVT